MARPRFERALALWREVGDRWGIAKALGDLGEAARTMGDYLSTGKKVMMDEPGQWKARCPGFGYSGQRNHAKPPKVP
jgi:hypothetical protein